MLLSKALGSLALNLSSHSFAPSSPLVTRRAVTKLWNEAFVGAKPIFPLYFGSRTASTVVISVTSGACAGS